MLIDNIYFYPPTQLAQHFQCTSLRLSWNGQVQDCTVQIYKIEQGSQGRQRWLILQSQWLFKPTKTITDIGLQNLNNHRSLLYIMWPVVAWSSHPIFPAQLNLRNLLWTLYYLLVTQVRCVNASHLQKDILCCVQLFIKWQMLRKWTQNLLCQSSSLGNFGLVDLECEAEPQLNIGYIRGCATLLHPILCACAVEFQNKQLFKNTYNNNLWQFN